MAIFLTPTPLPCLRIPILLVGGSLYNWPKWKIPLSSKNCCFDGDYIIFGSLHNLLVQYMLIKKKLMHCTCKFLQRTKDIAKVGGYMEHQPNEYLKNAMVFSTLANSATHHPLTYLPRPCLVCFLNIYIT